MNFVNHDWEPHLDTTKRIFPVHVRWLKLRGSTLDPVYKITLKSQKDGTGTFNDLCNITIRPNGPSGSSSYRILTPDMDLTETQVGAVWYFIDEIRSRAGLWRDLMTKVTALEGNRS